MSCWNGLLRILADTAPRLHFAEDAQPDAQQGQSSICRKELQIPLFSARAVNAAGDGQDGRTNPPQDSIVPGKGSFFFHPLGRNDYERPRRRWERRVLRRLTVMVRTAVESAFLVPTRTSSFFARVIPV